MTDSEKKHGKIAAVKWPTPWQKPDGPNYCQWGPSCNGSGTVIFGFLFLQWYSYNNTVVNMSQTISLWSWGTDLWDPHQLGVVFPGTAAFPATRLCRELHPMGPRCSLVHSQVDRVCCSEKEKKSDGDTTLHQNCIPFIFMIGTPRGGIPKEHKVLAYPSNIPSLYEMEYTFKEGL